MLDRTDPRPGQKQNTSINFSDVDSTYILSFIEYSKKIINSDNSYKSMYTHLRDKINKIATISE